MKTKRIRQKQEQRARRVRKSILVGSLAKMRISVFRSLNHIYAQIIDDSTQKTVVSSSSLKMDKGSLDKKAIAKAVGIDLAKKAIAANIKDLCFDRGQYLYHGRVKSLAEGLREGGLKI
ncbi:50S ribosomal protein L18 [Candidatus Dependentiae bacterium]|nr:50S ribosomal protein L18 [Candidatus Dependentiae bacterium]